MQQKLPALVDSRAGGVLASTSIGLEGTAMEEPIRLHLFDRTPSTSGNVHPAVPIILGLPWLCEANPDINWKAMTMPESPNQPLLQGPDEEENTSDTTSDTNSTPKSQDEEISSSPMTKHPQPNHKPNRNKSHIPDHLHNLQPTTSLQISLETGIEALVN
ncbi:hypothetical protein DXG01_015409 [Tephrocybe rancida]|nr:hypothetical protein DXG01_015409 [Tephrocybe rancida]